MFTSTVYVYVYVCYYLYVHVDFFDAIGQLDRAHEAAVAAQKLGDAAQLDYAPDEDRPLDLVRRIEGQMDATRLTQEPGTADESSAATRTEEPEETSQLSTQLATPPAKEAKGTPKTPRNWSTFFRREKKHVAPASEDPVTPGPLTQDPVTQVSPFSNPFYFSLLRGFKLTSSTKKMCKLFI